MAWPGLGSEGLHSEIWRAPSPWRFPPPALLFSKYRKRKQAVCQLRAMPFSLPEFLVIHWNVCNDSFGSHLV